ncbi:MAG TPA: cupredoxin domain-containing protein [Actinomycetota bacterium]|nr:cupredoxin domain-containing protein [Actinomycetota bacterium]
MPVRVVVNRAVLALLVAAAVACEAEPEGGAPFEVEGEPVATNTVDMPRSYRFEPAVIEIDAGTTVTWTNSDQFPHTVHLLDDSEVDENVPVGESIDIPFEQPGTVYYECSLHPQEMQGKIIVR